jgi:hypothetical protein
MSVGTIGESTGRVQGEYRVSTGNYGGRVIVHSG